MNIEDLANGLPDNLGELGNIKSSEEQAPGLYYLTASQEGRRPQEYYAVLETSPLFHKVRQYGKPLQSLRLYAIEDDASGWRVVEYELSRYMLKNGTPLPPQTLRDIALHAAERHPEYFGALPVPVHTPRGFTLRHRALANGIYWLETDRCEELLAVCYPIWSAELSDMVQAVGEIAEYDKPHGLDAAMGCLFFPAQLSCVAVFELMETRRAWEGTLVDKPALMNAIWKYLPKYALVKNGREQMGMDDLSALLLREFGLDAGTRGTPRHVISIDPDAGEDFLLWGE